MFCNLLVLCLSACVFLRCRALSSKCHSIIHITILSCSYGLEDNHICKSLSANICEALEHCFLHCLGKSGPLISDKVGSSCKESPAYQCAPVALWLSEPGGHSSPSACGSSVVHGSSLTPGYLQHIHIQSFPCAATTLASCAWKQIRVIFVHTCKKFLLLLSTPVSRSRPQSLCL